MDDDNKNSEISNLKEILYSFKQFDSDFFMNVTTQPLH